jgi:hypothetical protein
MEFSKVLVFRDILFFAKAFAICWKKTTFQAYEFGEKVRR